MARQVNPAVGNRVVVDRGDDGIFIGLVKDIRNDRLVVTLPSGKDVLVGKNSPKLYGITVKKRTTPIPEKTLHLYLTQPTDSGRKLVLAVRRAIRDQTRGISIPELMANQYTAYEKRAARVKISVIKRSIFGGQYKGYKAWAYDTLPTSGRKHQLWVYAIADQEVGLSHKNQKVRVACNCESFKYRSEVALKKKWNAARVRLSNGKDPVITNPQMEPLICKHLIAFCARLKARRW